MKKIIFAALAFSAFMPLAGFQDQIPALVADPSKIASVSLQPETNLVELEAALLKAVDTLPASFAERKKKKEEIAKAFTDLKSKNAENFNDAIIAAPEPFAGIASVQMVSSSTNAVVFEELEMDFGLHRKPVTMDKNKRYYPGWRRGSGFKGSNNVPTKEPGGYAYQTLR